MDFDDIGSLNYTYTRNPIRVRITHVAHS